MKVRSIFTYDFAKESNEVFDLEKEPSLTQPDETLSLKEILYRFTNGIVPMELRELPYDKEGVSIDDDVDWRNDPDITLSDIHERMNYHYDKYREMAELEKEKKEQEAASVSDQKAE